MGCSLQGFSVHGISQARTLEWVVISFSRGSSQPRDQTTCPALARGFFFFTTEPPGKSTVKIRAEINEIETNQRPTSPSWRRSVLSVHWKIWCWSWNSNTLATWCKELTYWKRPWCWERWKAGGEGDDRGWDGWMASPTQWTWVWVNSGSWWWTGRPGMLQSKGSQRVRHDWATELNWRIKITWSFQ